VDIWVLAGQSNMQGYGLLSEATQAADPRVEHLMSDGTWAPAVDPLHRLWESDLPVHREIERAGLVAEDRHLTDAELAQRDRGLGRGGAGLGIAFGSAMADATGRRIVLIPTAHGGTTLEQWSPGFGGLPRDSTHTLYGALLDRIARARARDGAVLRGVLWYQGESDATPARCRDYADRFDAWIRQLRQDLADPTLPVYAVQLGRFVWGTDGGEGTESSWDAIREAQRTLPQRTPHTGVVSAVDLALTDAIHLNSASLARLGRRLAAIATADRSGPDVVRVQTAGVEAHGLWRVRVACVGVTGGWSPGTHLPGFDVCERSGETVRRVRVIEARPAADDASTVELTTTAMAPAELEGLHVSYGRGYDPVCLAMDEADLPLPAFVPQPIEIIG